MQVCWWCNSINGGSASSLLVFKAIHGVDSDHGEENYSADEDKYDSEHGLNSTVTDFGSMVIRTHGYFNQDWLVTSLLLSK